MEELTKCFNASSVCLRKLKTMRWEIKRTCEECILLLGGVGVECPRVSSWRYSEIATGNSDDLHLFAFENRNVWDEVSFSSASSILAFA